MIPRAAGQASDLAAEFDPATSWRPAPAWQVVAWRGFGEARQRLKRSAATLAEGRRCADDLVAAGWESAEVSEKLEAPRRAPATAHVERNEGAGRRRRRRRLGVEGALPLSLEPAP